MGIFVPSRLSEVGAGCTCRTTLHLSFWFTLVGKRRREEGFIYSVVVTRHGRQIERSDACGGIRAE